jgi:hypothetical protein
MDQRKSNIYRCQKHMRAHDFVNNIFTSVSYSWRQQLTMVPNVFWDDSPEFTSDWNRGDANWSVVFVRQLLLVVILSLSINDHFLLFPADVVWSSVTRAILAIISSLTRTLTTYVWIKPCVMTSTLKLCLTDSLCYIWIILQDLEDDDALEDANLNVRKEQQDKLQYKSYKIKKSGNIPLFWELSSVR